MADDEKPVGESITAEGLAELEAEVAELEGPERKAMAARIKTARELGDLKENADYHIAKDDQAMLETRIKRLRQRLRMAVVVDVKAEAEEGAFSFGKTAEVVETGSGRSTSGPSSARPRPTSPRGSCQPNRRSGRPCGTPRWARKSTSRRPGA